MSPLEVYRAGVRRWAKRLIVAAPVVVTLGQAVDYAGFRAVAHTLCVLASGIFFSMALNCMFSKEE